MRLASFNLKNLFDRARALNLDTWAEGREALDRYARLNTRLNKATYTAADRQAILEGLKALGSSVGTTGAGSPSCGRIAASS